MNNRKLVVLGLGSSRRVGRAVIAAMAAELGGHVLNLDPTAVRPGADVSDPPRLRGLPRAPHTAPRPHKPHPPYSGRYNTRRGR